MKEKVYGEVYVNPSPYLVLWMRYEGDVTRARMLGILFYTEQLVLAPVSDISANFRAQVTNTVPAKLCRDSVCPKTNYICTCVEREQDAILCQHRLRSTHSRSNLHSHKTLSAHALIYNRPACLLRLVLTLSLLRL